MTPRERWMLAGLIAAFLGLATLGVWNQSRHQDVTDAVRRYVALDERQAKESPENAALVRQARPEIRRDLSRGEFEAALKRLKALEEEDAGAPTTSAKAIGLGQLWPAGSPERTRLKTVLADLVRKQSEGFDVAPAQQRLVDVAQAARAGKRDEALAAFEQAANMVRDAPLRPGFKAKVALAAATGGIDPAELQNIEKMLQQLRALRGALPRALLRPEVTPQQRHALEAAAVLFDEMFVAHEQKRDLRPILKLLEPMKKTFDRAGKANEWGEAEQQIQAVRKALKSLPLLPPMTAAAAPGQPPTPPAPPLPPVGPGPGAPSAVAPVQPTPPDAAGILRMLDFIRALPEDKYQVEKAKIGGGLALMLVAGRAGGVAASDPANGEPVGNDLQLVLGPQGEMRGLWLFGAPVATAGNDAGGISVQVEGQKGELPIRAPLTREQDTHRFRVENPQGAVSVIIKAGQGGLTLKVAGRRVTAGGPAFLNLSIPAQLGGWYWLQGAEPQPMAVDKEYRVQPTAGKLPKLTFRNRAAELSLEAPSAQEAGYRPTEGRIWIRLPLTNAAGTAEHTVHLTAVRRSP